MAAVDFVKPREMQIFEMATGRPFDEFALEWWAAQERPNLEGLAEVVGKHWQTIRAWLALYRLEVHSGLRRERDG